MNKMHEYEMKSFSQIIEFNQIFQKQVFQTNCPKKNQKLSTFASKSRNFNLGWPQKDHTQYNVPSLAKSNCVVCATSKSLRYM